MLKLELVSNRKNVEIELPVSEGKFCEAVFPLLGDIQTWDSVKLESFDSYEIIDTVHNFSLTTLIRSDATMPILNDLENGVGQRGKTIAAIQTKIRNKRKHLDEIENRLATLKFDKDTTRLSMLLDLVD